jgi:hypothetical protein
MTSTTGLRHSIASAMRRLISLIEPNRRSPGATGLKPLSPLPPSDSSWSPLTKGSSPHDGRFYVRKTVNRSGFTLYLHDSFRGSTWYATFPNFWQRQRYLDTLRSLLPNISYPPSPAVTISHGRIP